MAWYRAGGDSSVKMKLISFGTGADTYSRSGVSGNWTFNNVVTTTDKEVVDIVKSGAFKCVIVSERVRYGFASAASGFYRTSTIKATEAGGTVTITVTENNTTTVTPNYKNIQELTVLFVKC